ncbi:kinase-like domain-containing protein [Gautieria morchelliformis]|nr:kinase-like domain-containing protein [Gautieria morchelliformis]
MLHLLHPASIFPWRYDAYPFCRVTWKTSTFGQVELVYGSAQELVLVANDWTSHCYQSAPREGYLGRGIEKYAFRGRVAETELAIFQINPLSSLFIMSNDDNQESLSRALTHLATGDYFMESFHRRAEACNVQLPRMQFNAKGAFLGMVDQDRIKPRPHTGVDNRSLQHPTFLAAPLLQGEFRKYSGSERTGRNGETGYGAAVDAFAHHTVIDSNKQVLLCDLQGILTEDEFVLFDPQVRIAQKSDSGSSAINTFLREHVCNHICMVLKLPAHARSSASEEHAEKATQPRCGALRIEDLVDNESTLL